MDLFFGLSVSHQPGVEAKILLEKCQVYLVGSECVGIYTSSDSKMASQVSHLMIAQLSSVADDLAERVNTTAYNFEGKSDYPTTKRKLVSYFHVTEKENPWPDPSSIDLVYIGQKHDIHLSLVGI